MIFAPFVRAGCCVPGDDSGLNHVATFDSGIMSVTVPGWGATPASLRTLFEMGPKYRPNDKTATAMTADVKLGMKQELAAAMSRWKDSVVRAYANAFKQAITDYASGALQRMYVVIDGLQDGVEYTAAYKLCDGHNDSHICPVLDPLGDKWLKQLRKLFVVTTLDKLSNAFNVV